jgi:hypothetical protein
MLWGFWGQVKLASYPADWGQAEKAMANLGPGSLLVFPWHLYAVWSFSDGRITANPAPSFFTQQEVLVSHEAGFEEVPRQSADPFLVYVDRVLDHVLFKPDPGRSFGHLVAPLGIRYVVLLKEVNRHHYRFLQSQSDLRPLYEGGSLSVYENRAWHRFPIGVEDGRAVGSVADIIRAGEEERVTDNLYPAEPLIPPVSNLALPFIDRFSPTKGVTPVGASHFLMDLRCTDGWVLEMSTSRCHLGSVASFPSVNHPAELTRPIGTLRPEGLGLSSLIALASAYYLRRSNS